MESLPRYVQGTRASIIGSQPLPYHWVAATDYAHMVAGAYANPAAANQTLYVHGPRKYTVEEALKHYCVIVYPRARVSHLPFWAATLIAKLGGQKDLEFVANVAGNAFSVSNQYWYKRSYSAYG
ncbi:MAG: putative conserved protein YbjT, contains NAD(P)-binding and DUF2867 domains [Chloroflexi bacterium AL-W]|nr:putative conserved protein YbjT, contains NAD(P)-binding and DUF2867 domains [Chloroflexi bacterium AL-N1]NOK69462.1 putative conserved protein YbjT, contains NAD(P)-binding and DUF2867 domains [Chloroflexi bacterium AL-N10]NOK77427.1 putative conserved protein YbjT, contains NAD(P)-binding and DUF2867 domains [Chloroflexi bacterium AL-N5]NOK84278.1 putative conserved protein YbjT, contains NAD(P)-binding and DUF2867 domains [Chloroflexi bacterium AL-W]NOK91557.1 putative conserved protein Y